jgi:ketosteroid isomerase-like protein
MRFQLACCVSILMLLSACTPAPPKVDLKAAEDEIRSLDVQWSKSASARDLDAVVSYYSDDAQVLAPNAPIATTKAAIREGWAALLGPEMTLSWKDTKIEVAQSGELAYLVGTYNLDIKDAKGQVITDKGKLLEVWKKQSDGKWKVVADVFNSDLPPAPTAPPEPAKKK